MRKKLFMVGLSIFMLIIGICISKLYFSAENILAKRCDNGDGASCYSVGVLYENASLAADYLQKGCNMDHAQSCRYLGDLMSNDTNTMQKACEYNSAKACFALAQANKENSNEAVKYFKKSCENGDENGCFELASIYAVEELDMDNITKAFYLFSELCEKNNYEACYRLGEIYEKSNIVRYPTRMAYAEKYYKLACDKAYVKKSCEAMDNLNYRNQDIMKFRKLCFLNDAYSCNKLAEIYSSIGMAVDYSFTIAAKFYKKSCDELNDKEACRRVVDYYYWIKDDANEAKYAGKNCDEGYMPHCIKAAHLYRYSEYSHNISFGHFDTNVMMSPDPLISEYVPKNINKAVSYLLKACDKNSKSACYKLGDIYENEVKDAKKATIYYEKVCEAGDEQGCKKMNIRK
ncbi:MAG: sel1 repeat family protein [Campylobacteraceae bacterium]|jgi:TPR repeat protein|nr:sel1 repeat family protein [Campylobacteraceae bacterium]